MLTFTDSDLRKLGDTDLMVSPLGLGTVKFGRNTGLRYPKAFDLPSDTELRELLTHAGNLGINLLDTAPAYGESEERLGKLLSNQRDKWLICSKVGEQYVEGQSTFDFSAKGIQASINNSLKNLQTDYLDILLLHLGDQDELALQQPGVIEQLRSAQKAGKVRYIGASTKTVAGGLLAAANMDLLMVAYSIEDTSQEIVLEAAAKRGKGLLAKKVLACGHANNFDQNLEYIAQEQRIHSAIIGTINTQHLSANVAEMVSGKPGKL